MEIDGSILDLPLRLWTYRLVDDFLAFGAPEDAGIEYKGGFQQREQFADTLVSMANGEGGYIFVGVSENSETKRPERWPLLEPEKDHLRTVYNLAATYTTPIVRPRTAALVDPDSGQQVVIIRIETGEDPPYVVKDRGVKIRVGDQDRPADRQTLERLFARREALAKTREDHRARFHQFINAPKPHADYVVLQMFFAPATSLAPVRFGDRSTDAIRDHVRRYLPAAAQEESRHLDQMRFSGPEGDPYLAVRRHGDLTYWHSLSDPPSQPRAALPVLDIWRDFCGALEVADASYPDLTGYDGELYVGAAVVNIENRRLAWPAPLPSPRRIEHRAGLWRQDEVPHHIGDDPTDCARELLKSLGWHMGYDGCDAHIDGWGREGPRP
jgi:hypothetical protein